MAHDAEGGHLTSGNGSGDPKAGRAPTKAAAAPRSSAESGAMTPNGPAGSAPVLPANQKRRGAAHSSQAGALFIHFLRWNVPILSKLFRVLLGSDIYCHVPATLKLPHPYGITIHPSSMLGENVVILQNATIGSHYDVMRWGQAPVIEDDVWIGPGAVVLGRITVGRGAVVGANAVVTKNVGPGKTVVGINQVLD